VNGLAVGEMIDVKGCTSDDQQIEGRVYGAHEWMHNRQTQGLAAEIGMMKARRVNQQNCNISPGSNQDFSYQPISRA
jgi:uncharacterized protein YraI